MRRWVITTLVTVSACGGAPTAETVEDPTGIADERPLLVTGIVPDRGPPGSQATISGARFGFAEDEIEVTFKGTPAVISVVSDSTLDVVIPDIPTGRAIVFVTRLNAESDRDFTFFTVLPGRSASPVPSLDP